MNRKLWIATGIAIALSFDRPATAQTVFFDDFEAGAAQWTMTGFWHVEDASQTCGSLFAPFPSGTNCVWMGHSHDGACDYDDGLNTVVGRLTSAVPVALPATARKAWLRFKTRWQAETCQLQFDVSRVGVVIGATPTWIDRECGGFGWHKGRADLTPFLGQSVQVAFDFNSSDFESNDNFGWAIDDVQVRLEPGTPFCDAGAVCPCGNANFNVPGVVDEDPSNLNIGGCKHSFGSQGELFGEGEPSIAADTVVLKATDVPAGVSALFFQGTAQIAQTPLGDGATCVGGQLVRLGVKPATGGIARYPGPLDPPLGGAAVAGQQRNYAVYYRNALAFCTASTFNVTNAYAIDWSP